MNQFYAKHNGIQFLLPQTDIVKVCEDKENFDRFMINNEFGSLTPKVSSHLPLPFILKKRMDKSGINAFIIRSDEDLAKYEEQLKSEEFIKQEYFAGKEEYTTHFLCVNGKIVYSYSLKFVFKSDFFVKGLQSPPFKTATISECKTDYIELYEQILTKLNYSGVGCLNFKISEGIPKIFEINPRAGGSLPLDINNFLTQYIKLLNTPFKKKMKRFFQFP